FKSAAVIATSGTNSSRSRTTTCAMAPAAPSMAMRTTADGLTLSPRRGERGGGGGRRRRSLLVLLDVRGRGVDFLGALLERAEHVRQELVGDVQRRLDPDDLGVGHGPRDENPTAEEARDDLVADLGVDELDAEQQALASGAVDETVVAHLQPDELRQHG